MQEVHTTAEVGFSISRGAEIDTTGIYRYRLWRSWDRKDQTLSRRLTWIMLNPSTADATKDDATLRQITAFSKMWGYTSLDVFNLFALRATDPRQLLVHAAPVGPENHQYLRNACGRHAIVLAWGAWGSRFPERVAAVHDYLSLYEECQRKVWCLGFTKDRQPVHPLRLPHNTELRLY